MREYISIGLFEVLFSIYRFFNGVGLGFVLSVATIYIVEIASTDMRGVLGCFIQFMGGGRGEIEIYRH